MKFVKLISAIFLLLIFTISSVGILLVQSFCDCTQQMQTSFYTEASPCCDESEPDAEASCTTCHSHEQEENCCETGEVHFHHHDCDSSQTKLFKLDQLYVSEWFSPLQAHEFSMALLMVVLFNDATNLHTTPHSVYRPDAPPFSNQSWGKGLVIATHQIKIPTLV